MNDRVYVVLGATGSVGSETAQRLSAAGARLMLGVREPEAMAPLPGEFRVQTLDARDPAQVRACVERAVEEFGRLDGLVNAVGSVFLKPVHLTTDAEWKETLDVNLTSSFAALGASVRAMMREGGSIVLFSSAAARIGLPNHEAIAAAKGAIQGLVLSAAASYGHRNIRVNAVAPGLVRSRITERITSNEKALAASLAMHALPRIGEGRDIASAAVWLLDPANSWVTGQILGVDGGLGSVRGRPGS